MENPNEELVEVTIEERLSEALQENEANLKMAAPGSEEYERRVKERDMLFKTWLELDKFKTEQPSKWRKILDGAKTVGEVMARILQIGGSLALAVGMFRLSNRSGFMSADEMKALSSVERVLVK